MQLNYSNMKSIYDVISQSDKFSTICRNVSTGKVEVVINDVRRPFNKSYMIGEIRSLLREAGIPEIKGEAAEVLKVVEEYADEHKWESEESKKKANRPDWQNGMDISEKGVIIDSTKNNALFFENHPDMKGRIYYDEIQQTETIDGQAIDDVALANIKEDAEKAMGGNRSPVNIKSAVLSFCKRTRRNPLKEKLEELKDTWDGVPRLEKVFVEAFKCPDDEYHHYVTKVFFYAWINRMLNPGCKFDSMFIFVGDHGIGKSEFPIRLMRVINGRFAESVKFSGERSNLEKIAVSQLCVTSELKSMNTSTLEDIKELLGRSEDTFDKKFRSVKNYKRSCIFVGSVNTEYRRILKDNADYERRFIIFNCQAEGTSKGKHSDRSTTMWWDEHFPTDKMEQIWAEAIHLVTKEKNFEWTSIPQHIMDKLMEMQHDCKAFKNDDVLIQKLEDILDLPFVQDGYDNYDRFAAAIDNAKMALRAPKSGTLQWVKKPVLRRYLKDVMKEDRSPEYLDQVMRDMGWGLQLNQWDKATGKATSINRYVRNNTTEKQTTIDLTYTE